MRTTSRYVTALSNENLISIYHIINMSTQEVKRQAMVKTDSFPKVNTATTKCAVLMKTRTFKALRQEPAKRSSQRRRIRIHTSAKDMLNLLTSVNRTAFHSSLVHLICCSAPAGAVYDISESRMVNIRASCSTTCLSEFSYEFHSRDLPMSSNYCSWCLTNGN